MRSSCKRDDAGSNPALSSPLESGVITKSQPEGQVRRYSEVVKRLRHRTHNPEIAGSNPALTSQIVTKGVKSENGF